MSADKIKTANLLVELFVEELPPKALKKLSHAFAADIARSLGAQGLARTTNVIKIFATPRRLAVHVAEVALRAADQQVLTKLMPVGVGLDAEGKATPALLKRLAALGADASAVTKLRREGEGKNEALFFDSIAPGTSLTEGLQLALETAISNLPIPKVMTYPNPSGDGWETVHFVRPAHGLLALHGSDIVPISVLGLHAGRDTQGHRFEARVRPVSITSADSYAQQLKDEGAVIASFVERRAEIVRQLHAATDPLGLKPVDDEALLDEVTALVERPNVLIGKFEEAYLEVPPECLILTMKANQKYFPLLDTAGKLTNQFLIVSNISPDDASAVIQGNERVVRPRLGDAKFFFDQDRKKPLESRVLELAKVVYHNKLGTQSERTGRVMAIARAIGYMLGGEELVMLADRASLLAKADLLTDMVGEFPELQGIMGRYYALHDREDVLVAEAIEEHYKPRFAGDELPRSNVGVCVALADKLETLVGLFGIGQSPTGDKDPFALRRHALGVIRMLVERDLKIEIENLVKRAFQVLDDENLQRDFWDRQQKAEFAEKIKNSKGGLVSHGSSFEKRIFDPDTVHRVLDFISDRLAGSLREQSYSAQEIDAVLALRPSVLADIPKRLGAVRAFAAMPEAPALAAANKRVGNILKKTEGGVGSAADPARFVEAEEKALFAALSDIAPRADAAFESGDYTASLQALAALKAPIDAFFDSVMVNADDPSLRANRLALLNQLYQTMNRVADISRLAA